MCKQNNRYIWALLLVCIVSLIVFLGNALFNTKGEPREAVVAVSMLKYGNWILPVNNGVDMAYKPPFFHWCIALFSLIGGHVTEFTSRLPSAVALTAMTVAGYAFYAKRRGAFTALLAALVTISSFEMHRAGTNCRVDMVLTAAMVGALYALYRWCEQGLRGVPAVAIVCMAAAFLTKGPVGVVLPCLVTFIYLLVRGAGFWRSAGRLAAAAAVACIPPILWYAAAWAQGGDEFLQLVYEENVLRFTGKMSYSSHENPAWYNVVTLVAGYVPYTLLAVMSLFVLKYNKVKWQPADWWTKLRTWVRNVDGLRLFSLLAIVIIFVFYCIPKSKRSVYLLPIYPFIAYFLAEYIIYLAKRHLKVLRAFGYTLCAAALAVTAVMLAVRAGAVPETIFSGKHAAENIAYLHALEFSPFGIGGILAVIAPLAATAVYVAWRKRGTATQALMVPCIVLSVFWAMDGWYSPTVMNTKSDRDVAARIAQAVPKGTIYHYRDNKEKANIVRPFTVNFYLNDRIVPFDDYMPQDGYLLSADKDMAVFSEKYPDYTVTEVADFHHKSCDTRQMYKLFRFSRQATKGEQTAGKRTDAE